MGPAVIFQHVVPFPRPYEHRRRRSGAKVQIGESFGTNGIVPIQWADDIASIAIANGFGITAESLASTDLTSYAAGSTCSNDWCSLFNIYSPFAPMLAL